VAEVETLKFQKGKATDACSEEKGIESCSWGLLLGEWGEGSFANPLGVEKWKENDVFLVRLRGKEGPEFLCKGGGETYQERGQWLEGLDTMGAWVLGWKGCIGYDNVKKKKKSNEDRTGGTNQKS